MEVEIKCNIEEVLKKTAEFGKEFEALCNKYGVVPATANDDETGDIFFVVNVKDLINEEDIEVNIAK